MFRDDVSQLLKDFEPDITAILQSWAKSNAEQRFEELQALTHQENFWQRADNIAISQELEHLKDARVRYTAIVTSYNDIKEMFNLFIEDEQELESLYKELRRLRKEIVSFKLFLLLRGEHDSSNCFVAINAGAGGTESQDWADMMLRMYLRFCEREKFGVQVLDHQQGEEAGIKGATLLINGKNAYGLLKAEHGVHRLVRISPFDSNKRRHTSFASVTVTPEVAQASIEINEKDLRIDTYRAGGAGGQHVNKTDSAVRITHLPTNIVVQCQNERSQGQNKQTAMKMLMAKLVQKREEEQQAKSDSVEKQKIEWGSQIRSYVLHPYKMVKDLRTDHESPQPDIVLDGDLMPFIEALLLQNVADTAKES
ncbi:MAG: peptide chain release factor 2 [Candidatus Dependentiae bacterium]|nr:peptide chain release factor 2 [Candidatus Dependentiae bacterium]